MPSIQCPKCKTHITQFEDPTIAKCQQCKFLFDIKAYTTNDAMLSHKSESGYTSIAIKSGDESLSEEKEVQSLPDVLKGDEPILAFASGSMRDIRWFITLTNERIVFLCDNSSDLKQEIIDLKNITAILGEVDVCSEKLIIKEKVSLRTIDIEKGDAIIFANLVENARTTPHR